MEVSMPNVNIYLPVEMFMRLRKDGDISKTVQESLVLLWEVRDKKKTNKM